MNQLRTLSDILPAGRTALMTHVVLGYPSLAESLELAVEMAESGASLIELQIPFSDPIADGPTIMAANDAALAGGVTPLECLNAVTRIAPRCKAPLLLMTYVNIAFTYAGIGLSQFCQDARNAGVQGLIIPDVPPEENREGYWTMPQTFDLLPIPLVSPITDAKRLAKIATTAHEGFVYCVSTTGTTGARTALPSDLEAYLARVREVFSIPLAVGFGISSAEQVRSLKGHAEIAIVGSAMIDLIARTDSSKRVAAVKSFVEELTAD